MASEEPAESEAARAIKRIKEDDIKYDATPLGQGAVGIVWKGTWTCKVAIKKCIKPESGIPREVLALASVCSHENIITLYGVVQYQHSIGIVMEFATDGSLYDYLHKKGLKPSQDQSVNWAKQVAQGMKHLHDNDIIHGDLKSQNVLLSGKVAKICDFSTARFIEHTQTKQSGVAGTYAWMAPEVMREDESISRRCDTYSYAMVMYELFEHKVPFHEIEKRPIELAICDAVLNNGQRPTITVSLPPYIRSLIEICWREESENRLDFGQILQALETRDVSYWERDAIVIARSDLTIEYRVGSGGFGSVYKGRWKNREVAIKALSERASDRTITTLSSLGPHPNIVPFYGHALDLELSSTFLVMELVNGVSLYQLIHEEKKELPIEQRFQWMKEIAMGMEFLHENNTIHGDLKSDNVLIENINQVVKLIDFGHADLIEGSRKSESIGAIRWMAPEVLEDESVSKMGDVYSYSMVLVELVTLQLPFHDARGDAWAVMKAVQGKRPTLPPSGSECCPPYIHCLITTCWDEDPNKRPSFEKIRKALESKTFSK